MTDYTLDKVREELIGILKDMTSDWEIDDFSGDIRLDPARGRPFVRIH